MSRACPGLDDAQESSRWRDMVRRANGEGSWRSHRQDEDAMTTTPEGPTSDQDQDVVADDTSPASGGAGAEIGISEGEGSTFEPEEDPEGQ
ncbi:MAG: hypothetical protein AVDCRST_MAG34-1214 [uncultured Nocardioidaceae bacterium]|uniref:Uncharacterized protein n=1 Tax=uncultured Nocardioidaceae bacterium TaxID=253824 RepID=A0A6J4M022_9ACTN|nr:MAG: hypothetical protein AVDCRST_MAG34-1214 [uncultured Nocardioidaceae bacterium]